MNTKQFTLLSFIKKHTQLQVIKQLYLNMQKAWFYEEHGSKDVLKLGDFPISAPKSNQLLIQVHAAALNPIDFKLRQNPLVHLDFPVVPGCDAAGVVLAKGDDVTKFNIGDHVAEFVLVEEHLMAMKPKNLSFEEAASLPVAVQTAIEGFKAGCFKEGHSVFVVGGAGGVGSLVVQLARVLYRASLVTATTSTGKVEFVKSLGADNVVDYTRARYEDVEDKFDLVYDVIGDSYNSCVVAKDDAPIVDITWPPSNPRALHSGLTVSGEILENLRPLLESGKFKAVIDPKSPFHFNNVVEAFGYLETGRAWGKVVISPFPFKHIASSCNNNWFL